MSSMLRWGFSIIGVATLAIAGTWAADQPVPGSVTPLPASVTPKTPSVKDLLEKISQLELKISQLERQLETEMERARPTTPAKCKLSGQVEGNLVQLTAVFEFETKQPNARIVLGCQEAWVKGARLDDNLPLLQAGGPEGLVVHVTTLGVHKVDLELELPLLTRGTKGIERGFDLGLPRPAITTIERFTLPGAVPEARVNGRTSQAKVVTPQSSRFESIFLKPAERLEMTWKAPASGPAKESLLRAAEATVVVQMEETRVTTDVALKLETLRGEARQWRIQLPPQAVLADLKKPRPESEQIQKIQLPDAKDPVLTIDLKEAGAEPLEVEFQVHQSRQGPRVPVGPFTVHDAFWQRGTIVVCAQPDLRLWFYPRSDVRQQRVPEGPFPDNAVAGFTYWNLPAGNPGQPAPPLELQVQTARGTIETAHELLLTERGWEVTTLLKVAPVRPGIDRLEVHWPAGYSEPEKQGADFIEAVLLDPENRVAQIRLDQKRTLPFSVMLKALAMPLPAGAQKAGVDLPYPLPGPEFRDRGGEVKAAVPEGMELLVPEPGSSPSLLGVNEGRGEWRGARDHTWRSDQTPRRVDLTWRPYGPELPVHSSVQVTLAAGQARIRQELRFQFPKTKDAPDQVLLRVPEVVQERLRVEGRVLRRNEEKGKPATYWADLGGPEARTDTLILHYSVPLAAAEKVEQERRLALPLVWPAQATRVISKVLVWSDPEIQPFLAGTAWEELPLEIVPGKDSLPNLVLSAGKPDLPLALTLATPGGMPLAPVQADRVLMRTTSMPDGSQVYQARFQLLRLNTHELDVELPVPALNSKVQVVLDGKQLPRQLVEGQNNLIHLRVEPDLYKHMPVILEIRYEVPPQPQKMAFQTIFRPPLLHNRGPGEALLLQVRWEVMLPPGLVPLYQEGGYSSEQRWGWRGVLLAPRSAVTTSDLEHWLGTPATPAAAQDQAGAGQGPTEGEAGESNPSLVCWRSTLEPLRLVQVPEQAWLLACSLLFLVVGLVLCFAPLSRRLFWTAVAFLVLAVAVAALWWPTIISAVAYGCEPGLVVLVLILSFQWMLQRRYRRQVVFLPGFTRVKAGSSVTRTGSRPRGEPSTVDVPAQRESAAK